MEAISIEKVENQKDTVMIPCGDSHIHVIMDAVSYRQAVDRHEMKADEEWIRRVFRSYQQCGVTFLRDGGDHRQVSFGAKKIAEEFGIEYHTPIFAIHKKGHYGKIVGHGFQDLKEYRNLIAKVREYGGDFIKIMVSGLIDFREVGVLSEDGLEAGEIHEMIHIAHEEGFSVMAHTNGVRNVLAAVEAGVDSLEHGAFMNEECVDALAHSKTIWVPTLAPTRNLLGKGRYDDGVLREIARWNADRVRQAFFRGASIALGSDAGAHGVYHGSGTKDEYIYLKEAIGDHAQLDKHLQETEMKIKEIF